MRTVIRRLAILVLPLFLAAGPALSAATSRAVVEEPWPVAGICLQPADPDTTITLRSLRVEITLEETENVTQARVWARFSLVNPSRTTPVQAVVGLPTWSAGDRFFRVADIQGLTVTVNDASVIPTARPRPQVENETWLAWDMSFDILDRQFVEVAYTAPLESGSVPRVTFALSSGVIWADQVESAAVVVTAPSPFQREQILDPYPAGAQHDGQKLSWHFAAFEPAEDVGFTYITRELWGRVETARANLAAAPSAANHRTLGLLYLTLADRAAFFAQAVAELETAVRLDPTDVETHRALAQAYQARGLATKDATYLELAIRYWDRVRTLAPGDTAANANLRRCHYDLAQALLAQRAYRQALGHLEAALTFPATGSDVSNAALAQQRDRTRRTWAAYLFETGQDAAAVAVLRALGDPYEADYQAYAPAFAGVQGQVATHIASDGGVRQTVVTWTPFATAVLTDAAALATALQIQVPEAQIHVHPDNQGLEITLSFDSPAELREMLASLGQGMPSGVAWDPMRAILASGGISYNEHDAILWREVRYREILPLYAPAADLLHRRQALDALITNLTDQTGSFPEDPATLRLAALQSYRIATDRLLGSRVSSRVTLTGLSGYPQASLDVPLGEDHVLEAGDREWNLLALALALTGGGVALILLLLLGLVWRRAHSPATARDRRNRNRAKGRKEAHMPRKPLPAGADQDSHLPSADDDAPAGEMKKPPSLTKRAARQVERETIKRAEDESRARRQLAQTLGLEPDARSAPAPDEEETPPTLVERLTWRAEQEAIERGSDEFRAQRQLAEAVGLEPDVRFAPVPDEEVVPPTFVERLAWQAEQEAIERGSDEFRARRQLEETLGLEPEPEPPGEDPGKTETH